MLEEEIDQFKQKLLRMKAELQQVEKSSRESGETVVLDQSRLGRLSRMDAMQSQQMALETARRRKQQILKIDGALNRIATGDFGYCFICGDEIDLRRLSTDPVNTRCMKCVDK